MKNFIIGVIVVAVFCSIAGFITMTDTSDQITFKGKESFDKPEQALVFLEDVAYHADLLNATIIYNKLSLESPPTVSFCIRMPVTESSFWGGKHSDSFKYGEKVGDNVVKEIWSIVLVMWGLFVSGLGFTEFVLKGRNTNNDL